MSRCRRDPVEVRRRRDVPDQFLWRSRLYLVRSVLASWVETERWWLGRAGRALVAGETEPEVGETELQFWRVEAASGGRSGGASGAGVFDLCFDQGRGQWLLTRVLD
jgi:hypothetical protein